jgi:hypothetical protein
MLRSFNNDSRWSHDRILTLVNHLLLYGYAVFFIIARSGWRILDPSMDTYSYKSRR